MLLNYKWLAVGLCLYCCKVNAQFRKYSNEFLNIGAGARAMAMGNAQIASVNDGTAGYWNPAGLTAVKDHPILNVMFANYFAGIGQYEFAGIAIPSKNTGRHFGVSLLRFGVDNIPNTLNLVNSSGAVDYGAITSFSSNDYALLFSYAQQIKLKGKQLSFGGNAKIIHRNVGSFAKAWGIGLDFGLQYAYKKWKLGAVLKDATTTFNAWNFSFTDKEKQTLYLTNNEIPTKSIELTQPRLILGAAYQWPITSKINLMAESNLTSTFDGKRNALINTSLISFDANFGLELGINNTFFLRGGINNIQQVTDEADSTGKSKVTIFQPSFGAGIALGKNLWLDYAFSNLANQSAALYSHIFSLKIAFSKSNAAHRSTKKRVTSTSTDSNSQPAPTEKKIIRRKRF